MASRPSGFRAAAYELSAREEEVLSELTTERTTGGSSPGELLRTLFNLHYHQHTEFAHRKVR